jgi:hypothetical protein
VLALFDAAPPPAAWAEMDGPYRYALGRTWAPGPRVCWVMLNPSTADATHDDPTIRRCIGLSRAWGYGALVVVNLFALRATDPSDLYRAKDPTGLLNDEVILREAKAAARVVAAWGAHGGYLSRGAQVRDLLLLHGLSIDCLGLTNAGHPRHPLYLPSTATPESWRRPA